ncbi:hypothetical protein [Aeoliella sp. SH292]|uniref:hypothetical protein n=1 Tax=Aeoliella sp. SH292 TaxID=3454464 RepID=UPI003F9C1ECB
MRTWTSQLVLLTVFAVLVGDFAYRTWHAPTVPEYQVRNNAPTIAAPQAETQTKHLYLRRTWTFTEAPEYAWLQVMGHDAVEVFVNGEQVGQAPKVGSGRVGAVLLDITSNLHEGKNTVAIHARQLIHDRVPTVAIDGECHFASSEVVSLSNAEGWLASPIYDRRGHFWYEVDYPDTHWLAPSVGESAHWIAQVALPPGAITTPRTAAWITPAEADHGSATLATEFKLASQATGSWLRITGTGPYRVAINGWVIVSDRLELGTDPDGPLVEKTLDITPFLRSGTNHVRIALTGAGAVPRVQAQLTAASDHGPVDITSSQAWMSRPGVDANWSEAELGTPDWQNCREEVGYGGVVPRTFTRDFQALDTPALFGFIAMAEWFGVVMGVLLGATLGCVAVNWLLGGSQQKSEPSTSRGLPCWALLPSIVLAATGGLMTWDLAWTGRDVYQTRYLLVLALLPVVLWVLLLVLATIKLSTQPANSKGHLARRGGQLAFWGAWAMLVVLAGWLRVEWILDEAIHHDEVSAYNFTMSIFEYGFPAIRVHEDLPTSYCSTSELSYYFNALCALFVDDPRLVIRIPAALWSMATLLLIGYAGTKWFNACAGFVAAFLFAVSPHVIGMATFGRYLSEVQFFTLLTTFFAFEAVRGVGKLRTGYVWAAGLSFIAMYLSWEGSGLYAIGLVFATLLLRRRHLLGVLTTPAVYSVSLLVVLVVVAQNSHRILQQTQRLWYGTGISSLQLEPMWRFPFFDADFYLLNSSWTRDALLPTLAVIAAAVLAVKHRWRTPIRFVLVCLLTNAGLMAAFLPLKTNRYAYHLTELVILLAGASLVAMVDGLYRAVRDSRNSAFNLYANSIAATTLLIALAAGSGWLVNASELKSFVVAAQGVGQIRSPDWEESSRYVQENYQPGDIVISILPHAQEFQFKVLAGEEEQPIPVDYWLETRLVLQATIGDTEEVPRDRRSGAVMLYDLEQVKKLFADHDRIWYCTTRFGQSQINDSVVSQFLREHMDVMHEDLATAVMLRDKNHRTASVRLEEQKAGTLASDFYLE